MKFCHFDTFLLVWRRLPKPVAGVQVRCSDAHQRSLCCMSSRFRAPSEGECLFLFSLAYRGFGLGRLVHFRARRTKLAFHAVMLSSRYVLDLNGLAVMSWGGIRDPVTRLSAHRMFVHATDVALFRHNCGYSYAVRARIRPLMTTTVSPSSRDRNCQLPLNLVFPIWSGMLVKFPGF